MERHPHLQSLNLSRNEISVVENLEILGGTLRSLDLGWNLIFALGPRSLCGLSHVIDLNLSHNRIKMLDPLCFDHCRALAKLDLSHNQIDDVSMLKEALNPIALVLRDLKVSGNPLPETCGSSLTQACINLNSLDLDTVTAEKTKLADATATGTITPAKNIPPVSFEEVLETHQWAMNLIERTEQKVRDMPLSDLEARDAVWKEAVWTLAVQKRCSELEVTKIKERANCKENLELRATDLEEIMRRKLEKSMGKLEQQLKKLEALHATVESVKIKVEHLARLHGHARDNHNHGAPEDEGGHNMKSNMPTSVPHKDDLRYSNQKAMNEKHILEHKKTLMVDNLRLVEQKALKERDMLEQKIAHQETLLKEKDALEHKIARQEALLKDKETQLRVTEMSLMHAKEEVAQLKEEARREKDQKENEKETQPNKGGAAIHGEVSESSTDRDMVDLLREMKALDAMTTHILGHNK